ncbi:hypothetical protein [Rhodococcus opacus]|uniref:hypothetical protein n=1 Tax=Rhodococcus opacus TaxID=37919 RepID=UPI00105713A1|nr:hypothetical protein [Rhodococcus opacus]
MSNNLTVMTHESATVAACASDTEALDNMAGCNVLVFNLVQCTECPSTYLAEHGTCVDWRDETDVVAP